MIICGMVKLNPVMTEAQNVHHVQTSISGGMQGFHSECLHFCSVSNEYIQHIPPFALACGMIDGQSHIAHDTAICHNPQIYSCMGGKKHDISFNRTVHRHVTL
jgi:hypothetical protein